MEIINATKIEESEIRKGRPTTINLEVIDKICQEIRIGVPKHRAAPLAGISRRTFYYWMKKANEALDIIEKEEDYVLTETQVLYIALLHGVNRAEATLIHDGVKRIIAEGPAGYKWLLSKLFREDFGDSLELRERLPAEIQLELPTLLED